MCTPISVEIESEAEENSHPEHVRFNMLKWRELGFRACHVWSFHPKVEQEYEKMKEGYQKANTRVFILDEEGGPPRMIPPDEPDKQAGPESGETEPGKAAPTEASQPVGSASEPSDKPERKSINSYR